MNKPIITLIIILLTAYEATSQTSADTTCLPNEQLKKAINRIETCKVIEEELVNTKTLLINSEKRVSNRDSAISVFKQSELTYKNLVANYEQNLSNDKKIIGNLEKTITLQKRISRRQKLSKWIVGGLGIAIGYFIAK